MFKMALAASSIQDQASSLLVNNNKVMRGALLAPPRAVDGQILSSFPCLIFQMSDGSRFGQLVNHICGRRHTQALNPPLHLRVKSSNLCFTKPALILFISKLGAESFCHFTCMRSVPLISFSILIVTSLKPPPLHYIPFCPLQCLGQHF